MPRAGGRVESQRVMDYRITAGHPLARGATWDGRGVNFALFSAHATAVEVCLFDERGEHELARLPLPEFTDEIWHGYVPDIGPGTVYGYRVSGPYEPAQGHRFNPHKLLLDPYARAHIGELTWNPACFGYTIGAPDDDLSFDERDSAPFVPKCVVVDPNFDWHREREWANVPLDRTVVYELHVRGFTKTHPRVAEAERGTFAGLATREVIDEIASLGVTSVELLPVHTFLNEPHLLERKLTNYWGYNSIGFFAPDPRYAATPARLLQEFKEMVARFHDAGLEVILDVVYNHTAEGNEHGPTLSFRGIDNKSYYRLAPDARYYINDTGTGNTLNLSHPRVIQMVTDSLRYWVTEMHVDGFRFDLGTILAREPNGFDEQSGFLKACGQDPTLARVKLIAEPWDCGPGGYQVGRFAPGWLEWNDKFRDTVRDFWRGQAPVSRLAPRLCASPDEFRHHGRRPWASVNFITAHDGFTLADLVAYNDRHNEANGDENRDGTSDNRSWNCGVEGPTDDPGVLELRARQRRNLLATLLIAQGTPMVLAGDERGRTQGGNNNAYCQDNETSWLDWNEGNWDTDLLAFARALLALRREHPLLRQRRFLSGTPVADGGLKDLKWVTTSGAEMAAKDWGHDGLFSFGMLLNAPPDLADEPASALLLLFNAYYEDVPFRLPRTPAGQWSLLVDTAQPGGTTGATMKAGARMKVTSRSLRVFAQSRA
jgi:glycogen operon protein